MTLLGSILLMPLAVSLGCLLAPTRRVMATLNVCAFGFTLALGITLVQQVLANGAVAEWGGFLRADALSAWMVLLISVVSLGSALYAGGYFERDLEHRLISPARVREYHVLTPLFAAGMFLVVLADNIGVMWFALEATALSSVLLVALYNRKNSLEAAWKYIILGSLGLALALFGTVFLYAAAVGPHATERLPSFNWSHLRAVAAQFDPRLVKLAFVFGLVGYGTKAGLAPMHTWLPDAHSEAPSPTSAMLSGVSLKIALYALVRFHILAMACLGPGFSTHLLLGFGIGSMFVAAPFILMQRNLKRMLAYSSLEHVGLICAGVAMNTPVTIFGALLHMGYHALTKPVLFFAAGRIHQTFHSLEFRVIGGGVAKVLPVTAFLMGLAALAALGLPPFGLFLSEMTVISGGIAAGKWLISTLVLAALILAFCGILQQFTRLLLGGRETKESPVIRDTGGVLAMVLLLGTLSVFSIWLPAPLLDLLHQAAGIIGGKP